MKNNIGLFLLFALIGQYVQGQISYGGNPESFNGVARSKAPVIQMPAINNEVLLLQERREFGRYKPNRFAYPFQVDISPENQGDWEIMPNGKQIWRVSIKSKNAFSINLIFNEFDIEQGVKIFIYNKLRTHVLGAFTCKNNKKSGVLPTMPVKGDEITVEMVVDKDVSGHGKLRIGQVAHDYKGFYKDAGGINASGSCNVDINCPEGIAWQIEKRAVCKIIINGWETCTGSLINTTASDGTPYVYTANHCCSSTARAINSVFYFDFEASACDLDDGTQGKSISGSEMIATQRNLDFALVKLTSRVPFAYFPFFAGWSCDTVPPPATVTIHHPSGDMKKISFDDDAPMITDYPYDGMLDKNAFWQIADWEVGTTEGGSSGCPLFDDQHRIIGDLVGGDAYCGYSKNDYYGVFKRAYQKYEIRNDWHLKPWLDPLNLDVYAQNGFDPYLEVAEDCHVLCNLELYEDPLVFNHEGDWGYWTGHNDDSITLFAEQFYDPYNDTITGVYLNTGPIIAGSDSSMISFIVWRGGQLPGNEDFMLELPLASLEENAINYIDFGSLYLSKDTFYVGYEINYLDTADRFSVKHSPDRGQTGKSSLYLFQDASWINITEASTDKIGISLDIQVVSCGERVKVSVEETAAVSEVNNFLVYPNPSNGKVHLQFSKPLSEAVISVYNLSGKMLLMQQFSGSGRKTTINLQNVRNGMYFINVRNENFNKTNKCIIVNN